MRKVAAMLLAVLFTSVLVFSAQAQPPDIGGEQVFIQAPNNPGIPPGMCSAISEIILGLSGNVTLVAGDTGQFNLPVGITLCKDIDFFVGNNDSRLTVGLGPASGPTGNGRFGPIELFRAIKASGGSGVYIRVQGIPGSQSVTLTIVGDDTNDWIQLGGGDKELSLRLRLFDRALWTYNNTKYALNAASGWLFEDVDGNGRIISGDGDRAVRTPLTSDKNDDNAVCIQTPVDWTELIFAAFESQDIFNPGISKWDFTNDPGFQAGDSAIPIASILIEPEGLTARFTATPLAGTAPLTVSFTDQSSGFPHSWFWDFGDGTRSSEQNPTHTYSAPGTYTVSLRVTSSAGSATGSNTDYIVVYRPGAVAGVVTDAFTGIGIAGAAVSLSPGNYHTTIASSNPIGAYTLNDIPVGTYNTTVTAAGYRTATENSIAVANGAKTILNFALTPLEVERKLRITADPPCAAVGNAVAIAAHAAGAGHLYQYSVNTRSYCETEQRNWEIIQDWTPDTSVTWIPWQEGRYTIVVKAADAITDRCPQIMGVSYEVGGADCIDPVAISLSPATGAVNEPITITAAAGGADVQYSFWVNEVSFCDPSQAPNWVLLQDWSFSNSFTFIPESETTHTFAVWTAKDANDPCHGMGGVTYDVASLQEGGEGSWSFNEESGSVVYDTSGYGNDGVLHGATRVSGRCGGGLLFDGVDDYVEIPDHASLDMANGITLASWIKITQLPSSGAQTIVSKDANGTLSVSSGGTITGWLTNTLGDPFQVSGATSLAPGTWHHVALSAETDGMLKVYVDGIEDGSTPISGGLMTNADSLQIGYRKGFPESFFKGAIDEVHMYNRALAASEIQEAMACGVGRLSGFVRDAITGQNLGSASIIVLPGSFTALTGQSSPFGTTGGKYSIGNIPEGTYTVAATKEGYEPNTESNVMISAGETNSVSIGLNPE